MRKNVFRIGLILLFAFLVITVLYELPSVITAKTYDTNVDMATANGRLYYNGTIYQTAYALDFPASFGDRIVIIHNLIRNNDGNWATIFVEDLNGMPIIAIQTSASFSYSFDVGNSSISKLFDAEHFRIELGVVLPLILPLG